MRLRYSSFTCVYQIRPVPNSMVTITAHPDTLRFITFVSVQLADYAYRHPNIWVSETDAATEAPKPCLSSPKPSVP